MAPHWQPAAPRRQPGAVAASTGKGSSSSSSGPRTPLKPQGHAVSVVTGLCLSSYTTVRRMTAAMVSNDERDAFFATCEADIGPC